jgi:hypothetical protein
MKYLAFILLFLCLRSYASEAQFNCHDIAIAPDGMAWDPNAQNQLITGVVVCESENTRIQTQYKEGFKHGKEHITFTKKGGERINTYSKGEKIMECISLYFGTSKTTVCDNLKTGERTYSTQKR